MRREMYFERETADSYTRSECFAVTYNLREQDDMYDTQGSFVQFTIRPETVTLVWTRQLGGVWAPETERSVVWGHQVKKSGDLGERGAAKKIYRYGRPVRLTEYAASLPGLQELIDKGEDRLPV